jgi:hypothetical protein
MVEHGNINEMDGTGRQSKIAQNNRTHHGQTSSFLLRILSNINWKNSFKSDHPLTELN